MITDITDGLIGISKFPSRLGHDAVMDELRRSFITEAAEDIGDGLWGFKQ